MLQVKTPQRHEQGLTWQRRQTEATLLSDGHHLVLLLAMATVGHSQSLSAYKQNVIWMRSHLNNRKG